MSTGAIRKKRTQLAICFSFYRKPYTSWDFFRKRSLSAIRSLEPSCTLETWNLDRIPEKSSWRLMAQKVRLTLQRCNLWFCSDLCFQACLLFACTWCLVFVFHFLENMENNQCHFPWLLLFIWFFMLCCWVLNLELYSY